LPEVGFSTAREHAPAWGAATREAIESGLRYSLVGAARELLTRQRESLVPAPWVVWTGGDADWVATSVEGTGAWIVPDLVLQGLARAEERSDR
jgi:type III pantothenate kinase